jgi:hypothetical protein
MEGGSHFAPGGPVLLASLYAIKTYSIERCCRMTYSLKEYDLDRGYHAPRCRGRQQTDESKGFARG